uniref:F-box only protein 50 isoform X1 n=2 Tax=Tursiops truncatus TaxID=9739 RepID=A0A6J3QEM3_TURTR|nr:F-box only protein 50 isoform X1 [Tursiops truncatus]
MQEPSSTQELPSPPPPPSPPSPAAPETPGLPVPEQPTEGYAQQLLLQEWAPPGGSLELPPRLTWKLLFLQRPLYRNLLRSPNPEGINIYEPAPPTGPTQQPLETLGNFRGWHIKTEKLQQGLSWTVKQQSVDLLAEGLWEELLDVEQPNITVMDWYEDSRLDVCVYELHVWLLAADRRTVIAQHHVAPRTSGRGPPGHWVQVRLPTPSATRTRAFASQDLTEGGEQGLWVPHKNFFLTLVLPQVSHVFRQYGPGVRFVHFLHKTKNRMEHGGLLQTRVTDSSVSVQFRE